MLDCSHLPTRSSYADLASSRAGMPFKAAMRLEPPRFVPQSAFFYKSFNS